MGHSSGNQIVVKLAQMIEKEALMSNKPNPVKGLVLLDPVDSDPVKLTKPVIPLNETVQGNFFSVH